MSNEEAPGSLGILAHVDGGKTMLTVQMLYLLWGDPYTGTYR